MLLRKKKKNTKSFYFIQWEQDSIKFKSISQYLVGQPKMLISPLNRLCQQFNKNSLLHLKQKQFLFNDNHFWNLYCRERIKTNCYSQQHQSTSKCWLGDFSVELLYWSYIFAGEQYVDLLHWNCSNAPAVLVYILWNNEIY